MAKRRSYKDLESKWYKKLKNNGFEDIEDNSHPNRPLKEWHSLKAQSKTYLRIRDTSTEYQDKIEDFLNHLTFSEACRFVIKHGNCRFNINQARDIWILHTQGLTVRNIAKSLNSTKSPVFEIIKRLREWMKYL